MNLGYLAYRNMVAKPLNLILSLMLLSLSVSLVTFVLQLNQQLSNQLNKNIAPFDMVVGAKGSPLQLVLSAVYHLDAPTGNIKLADANKLMKTGILLPIADSIILITLLKLPAAIADNVL